MKWAIELRQYDLCYKPRLSLKGQVLTDFIAKLPQGRENSNNETKEQWWILHVDKASRSSGVGVGLVLLSLTKEQFEQIIYLNFLASNNEVEYEATLVGLNLA